VPGLKPLLRQVYDAFYHIISANNPPRNDKPPPDKSPRQTGKAHSDFLAGDFSFGVLWQRWQ
jgi:hypothetical protein